jgi:hemerythrin
MSQFISYDPRTHSLHMDAIDRQHDTLILIMNELVRQDAQGASKEDLGLLLEELRSLTVRHFQAEEAYMRATGYARLDIHGLIHAKLIARFQDHVKSFENGNGRLGHRLQSFLEFWLAAHIKGVDRHYAQHVATRSAQTRAAR